MSVVQSVPILRSRFGSAQQAPTFFSDVLEASVCFFSRKKYLFLETTFVPVPETVKRFLGLEPKNELL